MDAKKDLCLYDYDMSFNPRARDGRECLSVSFKGLSACFNPRARDGREGTASLTDSDSISFNPRARDGRELSYFW